MTEPAHDHEVQPAPSSDQTVRRVAELLLVGAAAGASAAAIARLLKAAGLAVSPSSVLLALKLTDHSGTSRRGTRVLPRAVGQGAVQRAAARAEAFYRAAFVIAAAVRIQGRLMGGASPADAVRPERLNRKLHEQARRGRLHAAAAVADAAGMYGDLLGWHAVLDGHATPECKAADGTNFSASEPPVIGWPGTLHGSTCRCQPGFPFADAPSTDSATAHLVRARTSRKRR